MHAHPHLHWTFAPAILFPIAVYAWLYIRRYREVRRTSGPRGAGARQLAAFIGSILVLLIALVSPLDALGENYLFAAHMVQHLLLGDIAPLLMLLALSRVIMRPLTRRLQVIERGLGPLAHPASALVLWLGLVYLWHIPALYDAALEHDVIHVLEHVCFGIAGALYWWHLLSPIPARHRLTGMGPVIYMVTTKVFVGILGIVITFAPDALYDFYANQGTVWGMSPTTDQHVAGALMAVEQSLVMGTALAWLFIRMLGESQRGDERQERYEPESTVPSAR